MKLIFEFARIAAFCFAGEVCHLVLPLPIPASVYGLMLLLAALRFAWFTRCIRNLIIMLSP